MIELSTPLVDTRGRWLAAVAASSVLGVAVMGLAVASSRQGSGLAYWLFWVGLLLVFVPIAIASLRTGAERSERLACVLLLGGALYLIKVLGSPGAFTFTDEFVHLRNTQDILQTGGLFAFNPLLPTAAYYPGLAAVTAGFAEFTGLTPFVSGVLIVAGARVLVSASLFFVAERVTHSARAAAGASLIYAANPMFLFWGATFAYENVALPLAAFAVWWLGRTRHQTNRLAHAATAIAIVSVTVTHHVAGFALAALLAAWWLVEEVTGRTAAGVATIRAGHRFLGLMAVLASLTSLAWLFLVARPAAEYLVVNNLIPALRQTMDVILGLSPPRRLYESGGVTAPMWETVAGIAAVGLLLLAIPLALYRAWPIRARTPIAVAAGVALAYPLSLAPRLAPNGVGISGRSSEYVFFGLACLLGLLAVQATGSHAFRGRRTRVTALLDRHTTALGAGLITLVFIGNVTVGTAFYQRLPEPTHPAGYPWSVQADVIAASTWARAHLGTQQPFGANAIDALALATYGEQNTLPPDEVWPIFFAESIDQTVVSRIQESGLRYVLVNWRMTRGVPATPGYYFSPFEPSAGRYEERFPTAGLQKFDSARCIARVYQADDIEIFDLEKINDGSCAQAVTAPRSSGSGG